MNLCGNEKQMDRTQLNIKLYNYLSVCYRVYTFCIIRYVCVIVKCGFSSDKVCNVPLIIGLVIRSVGNFYFISYIKA